MIGSTELIKRRVNIILEFLVIVFSFFLSGFVRVILPIGMRYSFSDTVIFFYIGLLYACVFVCVNYLLGSYASLKIGKVVKEFIYIAFSDVVTGVVVTSIIYLFRLEQISRLFLGIFIVLLTLLIMIKRIILSAIYIKYSQSKGKAYAVIVGSGAIAQRFAKSMELESSTLAFKGYVSGTENTIFSQYLGSIDQLETACRQEEAKQIFLIQEECSKEEILKSVAVGNKLGIPVSIIPTFAKWLPGNGVVSSYNQFKTVPLCLFDTSDIMGVNVAVTDMEKTVALIEEKLDDWKGEYICVANVHTTVTAHDDSSYLDIQNHAVMVLPDGGPLSAYSREHDFQNAERVTGPDLMRYFLKHSDVKKYRHFFYGSTQATLDTMREKFTAEFPKLEVCGMYSPPFRALTKEEDIEVIRMINEAKPDFLWVGLGAPKQEIWMHAHKGKIQALMLGVGAAFDYEAGNIERAPQWMQKHSLEWLYRLMQNPRRLFKRYFVTNSKFLLWKFRR